MSESEHQSLQGQFPELIDLIHAARQMNMTADELKRNIAEAFVSSAIGGIIWQREIDYVYSQPAVVVNIEQILGIFSAQHPEMKLA